MNWYRHPQDAAGKYRPVYAGLQPISVHRQSNRIRFLDSRMPEPMQVVRGASEGRGHTSLHGCGTDCGRRKKQAYSDG